MCWTVIPSYIERSSGMEGTPVDSVVLSLFQLQVFYYNEVKRGLAGLGEYTLLPEFSYLHEHCLEHCEEKSPKGNCASY